MLKNFCGNMLEHFSLLKQYYTEVSRNSRNPFSGSVHTPQLIAGVFLDILET